MLIPCLVSLLMLAVLQLFLGRTFIGRAILAVSQDRLALQLMAANPDCARVRTGNDDEVGIPPGVDRRMDLADHLGGADDLLSLVMAAFLRAHLILDVECRDPGFLVFADSADHVDRIAIAGIGIGDDRDADRLDRQSDKANILGQGQQSEIGIAVGPRIAAAGQINRCEPGLLDEPRR
jgi:hypothetical protein